MSETKSLVDKVNQELSDQLKTISEKADKAGRIKFLTGDDESASATFIFAVEDEDDESLYFEIKISTQAYRYSADDSGKYEVQRSFFGNQAKGAIESLSDDTRSKIESQFDDIYVSIYVNDQMV